MGGVIIILTRGMGKRLTYGIPACYRVVLVECLLACSNYYILLNFAITDF